MRLRLIIPKWLFLHGCRFSDFLWKMKRSLPLGLIAALLSGLFVSTSVAQSSTNVSIFRFAIFYNMDLEINAAVAMNVAGPVWSNGGFWSGANITFASYVSAVGLATNSTTDPFCTSYTSAATSTYLMAGQPTSTNTPLPVPMVGTNTDPAAAEAIINLPPAAYAMGTPAAYTSSGQTFLANGADLYLTNFANGTNWASLTPRGTNMILYYQDAANGPGNYLTRLPYDLFIITNQVSHTVFTTNNFNPNQLTNIWYAGYSFVTNVLFYDWREGWNGGGGVNAGKGKAVQAVQFDVGKFNAWIANTNLNGITNVNGGKAYNLQCSSHKSHPIDSIYVYNAVPLTGSNLPAVRIINGGALPSHTAPFGLTVATAMPLYVLGDYNVSNNIGTSINQNSTTYTWPAGLIGDSITILSDNWNDNTTAKKPSAAADTTVNAACLAGIVRSTNGMYSGGVENFFRLLETWGTFYWNGSIVAMFPSRYATNSWQQTGNYYVAPTRSWAFDTNFLNLAKLPPLTPSVVDTNPPTITFQPTNQTVISGSTAIFTVQARSSLPLGYQWQFTGTNINLATNASLILSNAKTNQAGYYAVLVTNANGSILSSNAVLTVLSPPSIWIQPTNKTVITNGTAIFSVTAKGSLPLSYQWGFNGTNLSLATNDLLMLFNVQLKQAGSYSVTVTNQAGSVTSSNVLLSVYTTAAATLDEYSLSTDNGFQFRVTGVPGFNYAVEESTNLFDWISLITNASPYLFVDENATNSPAQFYRAYYVP